MEVEVDGKPRAEQFYLMSDPNAPLGYYVSSLGEDAVTGWVDLTEDRKVMQIGLLGIGPVQTDSKFKVVGRYMYLPNEGTWFGVRQYGPAHARSSYPFVKRDPEGRWLQKTEFKPGSSRGWRLLPENQKVECPEEWGELSCIVLQIVNELAKTGAAHPWSE